MFPPGLGCGRRTCLLRLHRGEPGWGRRSTGRENSRRGSDVRTAPASQSILPRPLPSPGSRVPARSAHVLPANGRVYASRSHVTGPRTLTCYPSFVSFARHWRQRPRGSRGTSGSRKRGGNHERQFRFQVPAKPSPPTHPPLAAPPAPRPLLFPCRKTQLLAVLGTTHPVSSSPRTAPTARTARSLGGRLTTRGCR